MQGKYVWISGAVRLHYLFQDETIFVSEAPEQLLAE